MFALKRRIKDPFLIMVFDGVDSYHAWSSDFVTEYRTLDSYNTLGRGTP
jgi:hypothetical protein